MRMAALLLVCAFVLRAQTQKFGSFLDARIRPIEAHELPGPAEPKALLPLTAVVLRGTSWSEHRALRHLRKTAATFAACGVALGPVTLIEARTPDGRHDLDMTTPDPEAVAPAAVSRIAALLPPDARRPAAFFAGRLLGDEALARSYGRGDVDPARRMDFPYMDTAWLAYKAHWIERGDEQYSSLAHELAHLLCECGHVDDDKPHLLNTHRNMLSSRLLPEHCRRILASPLLTPPPSSILNANP